MINEKTLLSFMKESLKGGGVQVRRLDWHCVDYYILHSGWWGMVAPAQEIPSKCLALITQIARQLPFVGEGFLLKSKYAEKSEDPETIGTTFLDYIEDGYVYMPTKFTGLVWKDSAILQRKDLKLTLVKEEARTILTGNENLALVNMENTLLMWQDIDSGVYFFISAKADKNPEKFLEIESHNYWEEERDEY
ncbi:MAG: hypothetical protein RR827_03655 [Oscillospiraceae bacterium]